VEAIAATAEGALRTVTTLLRVDTVEDGVSQVYRPVDVVLRVTEPLARLGLRIVTAECAETETCGDPSAFEGLIQSLLGNCMDHADESSTVTVQVSRRHGSLRIDMRNRATRRPHHESFGLGRYIASQLAARCGATVSYHSDGDTYATSIELSIIEQTVPRSGRLEIQTTIG